MDQYIDGFVFPIAKEHLEQYRQVAQKVGEIWLEYGAISYQEYWGDDMNLPGTLSFENTTNISKNEVVIFGWVVFPSKTIRDEANLKVPLDPRMEALVAPLVNPQNLIFKAERMIYGGFKSFIRNPL